MTKFLASAVQLILLVATVSTVSAARGPKRVEVTNLPATQAVEVTNLPATQNVQIENFPEPPLAPTKPSQLITIRSSGAVTCGTSPWLALDQQVNQDGTLSPFTIPAGKVMVVTSIDWRQGNTGAPGKQGSSFCSRPRRTSTSTMRSSTR